MTNYFEPIDHIVNEVAFEYLGGLYRGPGILKWRPQKGFKLEAFLQREGPPPPKEISIPHVFLIKDSDLCSIRLRLWPSGSFAIAPSVPLSAKLGPFDLLAHGWISINLPHVIFLARTSYSKRDRWIGSASYRIAGISRFFEPVTHKTLIEDYEIQSGHTFAGIRVDEKDRIINGLLGEDKKTLELHWSFSRDRFSKKYSWRWGEAAAEALSILFGQTVWMVKREMYRDNRSYSEVIKYGDTHDLDYLAFFHPMSITKQQFLEMTDFIARDNPHTQTCHNIFNQMLASSKQNTRQAQELLISTVLEAALRTVDNHPFKEGDQSWNIRSSMESFLNQYLTTEWKESCEKALEARKRLRHRNAHPDWLYFEGGALSDEEREKSLDDMIFLSKFYGYMILALVGFKGIEPKFPKPHKDWDAMITHTSTETDNNQADGDNQF